MAAPGAVDAQAPAGLDPTFAFVNLSPGDGPAYAMAVALHADNKILLAGSCMHGGARVVCIARPLPGGNVDSSFGSAGFAYALDGLVNSDSVYLGVQSTGRIVIASACLTGGKSIFCAARLMPDGSPDASFGDGSAGVGRIAFAIGSVNDAPGSMLIQADDKIVLPGGCSISNVLQSCIARLTVDGLFDSTFVGPAGNATGKFVLPSPQQTLANGVAAQPDGKLVLAEICGPSLTVCATRLMPDGALDATFDGPGGAGNGRFALPFGTDGCGYALVAVQADGKLIISAACGPNFRAVRIDTTGVLDSTFASSGILTQSEGPFGGQKRALVLQSDGKILAGGYCGRAESLAELGYLNQSCVFRFRADGSVDATFGDPTTDVIRYDSHNDNSANALLVQQDGKIVVVGGYTLRYSAIRLNGGPFDNQNCKLDIDGDGRVDARTDVLIMTRIALGLRGAAVLSGISFAASATRSTWPAIRDYLGSHCGMVVN